LDELEKERERLEMEGEGDLQEARGKFTPGAAQAIFKVLWHTPTKYGTFEN